MSPDRQIPIDIAVDRTRKQVTIKWNDDKVSEYSFAFLRAECPCAHCRKIHEEGPPDQIERLDPASFSDIEVNAVSEVGNYALRFEWSDGHNLGIYSFAYLRNISSE